MTLLVYQHYTSLGSPPCQTPSPATPCHFRSAPLDCPGGRPHRTGQQADLGVHLLLVLPVAMGEWPLALELAVGGSFLLHPCLARVLALAVALQAPYPGLPLPMVDLWEVAWEGWGWEGEALVVGLCVSSLTMTEGFFRVLKKKQCKI